MSDERFASVPGHAIPMPPCR